MPNSRATARQDFGLAGVVACDPPRDLWNFLMVFGDAPKVHTLNPEP